MSILVHAAMFGWIPAVVVIFLLLPPQRAVIIAFLGAYLFLPMAGYSIQGLPDYTKTSAACAGVALCAVMMDAGRLASFRLKLIDLPMICWCVSPLVSSLTSGYGLYDGAASVFGTSVQWGAPYFLGRLYLGTHLASKDFLVALVIAGLIYTPLVLFEWRMSPQLHRIVYGFHPHDFGQTKRFGGWRPQVFLQHGLAVGMFMAMSALAATGLWWTGIKRQMLGVPMWCIAGALLGVAVLVKSTGAIGLLAAGVLAIVVMRRTRSAWALLGLLAVPGAYILVRTVGGWNGQEAVEVAGWLFGEERAGSLRTRITSENLLWRVVQPQLLFGASRFIWAGMRFDGDPLIPDGMWLIALGTQGLIGLIAFLGLMIGPAALVASRLRRHPLADPGTAATVIIALMLSLYMIDCLLNAMHNPVFLMASGGLASIATQPGVSNIGRLRRPAALRRVAEDRSQHAHIGALSRFES